MATKRAGVRPRARASWADVSRIALALPGSSERRSGGLAQWRVADKLFVWERPLRKSDLEALGARAPEGPILGVRVADLSVKEMALEGNPRALFTTPHFDGYPAVLVRLDRIVPRKLEDLIVEAWLARAPKRAVQEYLGRASGKKRFEEG